MLQRSQQGEWIRWRQNAFSGSAVYGTLTTPLEHLALPDTPHIEYASVKKEPGREMRGMFSFDPAADITLVREPDGHASWVIASLEAVKARSLLERLIDATGF